MDKIVINSSVIWQGYFWQQKLTVSNYSFPEEATFAMQVRRTANDPTALVSIDSDLSDRSRITRAGTSELDIYLAPEDTILLKPGRVVFDVVRTDTEPKQLLGFTVTVTVRLPVTRDW